MIRLTCLVFVTITTCGLIIAFSSHFVERKQAEQTKLAESNTKYEVEKSTKALILDCRAQASKFKTPTNTKILGVCAEIENNAAKKIAFGETE
jgi:hypothetical protein